MASVAGPPKKLFLDEPTSTLQYVNAQLVAHGFSRSPDLSLDGLANDDSERIVKCLLAMLSQRMEDLQRTEELGSKLRMINYEHERLQSMHRTAVDMGANAEREMNLFKSKMVASQRSLTSEVSAHKQTMSELQRTRTSLQYLRSTTQNELKRKDKEVERVLDRWNKVSDAQIKLVSAQSGFRCANLAAAGEEYAKGKGLMEEALEQAEEARKELVKENEGFRSVILGTANVLQGMVYNVKGLGTDVHVEEPIPLSHTAVFAPPTSSLPHPDNAHAKVRELMVTIREAVSGISNSSSSTSAKMIETEEEVSKLKDLVKSLRDELTQARQSPNCLTMQAQEVLDKFTTQASERLLTGRDPTPKEAAEMSMELIGVVEQDELREMLDRRGKEFQTERDRFTEATVKLGREKAALEMERLKLLEEKRRWAVDQMLAELPPTPSPDFDLASPQPRKTATKPPSPLPPRVRARKAGGSKGILKSPSKKMALVRRPPGVIVSVKPDFLSSKKRSVGRENTREETATAGVIVSVKPDFLSSKQRSVGRENREETANILDEPGAQQVKPTGATENGLQRSTTPEDWPPVTPPATAVAAGMRASLPLVLPTTFTLPPPSPASSLAALDLSSISPNASASQVTPSSIVPSFDAIPLAGSARPPVVSLSRPRIFPSTHTSRPLINARMKHAYSPARPSPLSRILMIADSPPSPPTAPPIHEEIEIKGVAPLESRTNIFSTGALSKRFLARELQLEAPIDEPSPLRERTGTGLNGAVGAAGTGVTGTCGESKLIGHDEKRFTAREKGKGRAVPVVNEVTVMGKENVATVIKGSRAGKAKAMVSSNGRTTNNRVKTSKPIGPEFRNPAKTSLKPPSINETASRTGTSSGPTWRSGGVSQSSAGITGVAMVRVVGARRVPIDNANASEIVKKL